MKYSKVCGLDKEISKLVFGTATPKLFKAIVKDATEADKNEAFALLNSIFALGVNTFDCASHYGEEIMGQWMESRGKTVFIMFLLFFFCIEWGRAQPCF